MASSMSAWGMRPRAYSMRSEISLLPSTKRITSSWLWGQPPYSSSYWFFSWGETSSPSSPGSSSSHTSMAEYMEPICSK